MPKNSLLILLSFYSILLLTINAKAKDTVLNDESEIHDTIRISQSIYLAQKISTQNLDTSILILENTVRFCNRISSKYFGKTLYKIQILKSQCLYDLSGSYAEKGDSSNQFFYLRQCQDIKTTLGDTIGLLDVFIAKGLFYAEHGKYEDALNFFDKSLQLAKKSNNTKGIAEAYNNIGYVQNNNGQVAKALDTYYKGLHIQEEISDLKGAASTLNNIAFIYYQQEDFNKALEYWEKSLNYRLQTKDNKLISHSLLNLGSVYYKIGNVKKALEYFEKSYKIQLDLGDRQAGAYSLNNIGYIYNLQKDYKNAQKYWEECLKIRREINDKKGQAYSLQNLSALYLSTKNYNKALELAKESMALSKELGMVSLEKTSYHRLYRANLKLKQHRKALEYFTKYVSIKDSLVNEKNTKALAERDAKYKYEIKQIADSIAHNEELVIRDINLSKQKAIVQKQKVQQYALFIVIVLILVILILGYRMLTSKQKANLLLRKQKSEIEEQATELYTQNEEIQAQRDEIEFQKSRIEDIHRNVKDSIAYAKNIQSAILPQVQNLNRRFSDSFVLFKPKDVVSGDFYWWTEVENHSVITAADCTGHGVPGAFMSMLGISFLREIVNKEYITHTGVILRKLRKEIVKSLKQKLETSALTLRDGMDMSLISINHESNILQYSGANNPLYLIKENPFKEKNTLLLKSADIKVYKHPVSAYTLYEIKPDKMPIAMYEKMDKFTTHEIQLTKGDQIYLFSDGYPDQFGGPKGKKFKHKAFKKLLLENADKPMSEQLVILENTFRNWQGQEEQVDDVVVLGIKI